MKKRYLTSITGILLVVFFALPILAQSLTGNPFSSETKKSGFISIDNAKKNQQQKKNWTQKYKNILDMAKKRGLMDKKNMSKVRKSLDQQLKEGQQDTAKIALTTKEQLQKAAGDIAAYSLHYTKKEDGTWLRWYNGKLTGIAELFKDNYGNTVNKITTDIQYPKSDQFISSYASTEVHPSEYKVLLYHLGKTEYDYVYNVEYNNTGDLENKPSKEIHKKKTVSESDIPLPTMKTTDEINNAFGVFDNNVEKINNTDTLETTETRSNITYSTLQEELANPATATQLGNIYGEPTSYAYEISKTDGTSESGYYKEIKYILKADLYPQKKDDLWWHAQDASLQYRHYNQEPIIGSYINTTTSRGITKEIRFDNAVIDSNNNYNAYRERIFVNGKETESHSYSNINYNTNGYIDSYNETITVNDLSYTAKYWGLEYNDLGQTTGYWYSETISEATTTYHYYNYIYNNLWQATSYNYTKNNVLHAVTDITYENGLVKKYTDTSTTGDVTTTIIHENFYNSNGLITSYIEQILEQSSTSTIYTYVLVDDFTYDSYYRITGFKQVSIRNNTASPNLFPNLYEQSIIIKNSLIYDGTNYSSTDLDMSSLGFDDNYELYTEVWMGLDYGSGYNLITDFFRGSLRHYNQLLRTTEINADGTYTHIYERTVI